MEFRALIELLYLPHQIATDFDKSSVFGKLRLRASKRRKNRQNRTRSDGVNGLLKVGRNFFFKKCTILCFFAPSLPKEKYFGKIPDIYLYFFFRGPPKYLFKLFFRSPQNPIFIYFFFFLEKYLFI